jgi:hypothetical protein
MTRSNASPMFAFIRACNCERQQQDNGVCCNRYAVQARAHNNSPNLLRPCFSTALNHDQSRIRDGIQDASSGNVKIWVHFEVRLWTRKHDPVGLQTVLGTFEQHFSGRDWNGIIPVYAQATQFNLNSQDSQRQQDAPNPLAIRT